MAILRCTLKLRDGRVHVGYTPAFDPSDRSLWLTATPDSPAGTMFTLDRVRVLVLESVDGRPVAIPASTVPDDASQAVRLDFGDGESLGARQKAAVPGLGVWVSPAGRARARAFIPQQAAEPLADADAPEDDWSFLPPPPTLPPSRSSLTLPLMPQVRAALVAPTSTGRDDSMPPPSRRALPSLSASVSSSRPASSSADSGVLRDQTLASSVPPLGDSTPTDAMPVVSQSDVDAQHTQPVALPLDPPPVPSTTWPDGVAPDSTSSITTPDMERPDLDD